jgi:arginase
VPGHEASPSALRSAGLINRLKEVGYDVVDLGDDPVQISLPDPENPRTRNLPAVVKSLETLKPKVEQAVKSGALPLIVGGDCSVALATVAGVRRYMRNVGLIYVDRDADLNTPATTASGSLDGMVVSHLIGRGAPELVRLWGQPPLVREPDLVLFGVDRLDPPEEEWLKTSMLPRYLASDIRRLGVGRAAHLALEQIHSSKFDFVLHFDVDVISDFQFTNHPGNGGLSVDEAREILSIFLRQERLAAVEVTAYNPQKDSAGAGAELILELLTGALRGRTENASPRGSEVESVPVKIPLSEPPDGIAPQASAQLPGNTDSATETASVPPPINSQDE